MGLSEFFANPSFWGIGTAILFGTIWLAPLEPLRLNRISTWLVFLGGAIVFPLAIVGIQSPLQNAISSSLVSWLGQGTYGTLYLFTGIPLVLVSGLVQEGARLLPMIIYRYSQRGQLTPVLGLTIGAMAGAGMGIFEAQWINNLILASGWSPDLIHSEGFLGIAGFWERFFTVGFHISIGALVGWGLANGYGWQAYLIASFIHGLSNYSVILVQAGRISLVQVEVWVALIALILFGMALRVRWKNTTNTTNTTNTYQ